MRLSALIIMHQAMLLAQSKKPMLFRHRCYDLGINIGIECIFFDEDAARLNFISHQAVE